MTTGEQYCFNNTWSKKCDCVELIGLHLGLCRRVLMPSSMSWGQNIRVQEMAFSLNVCLESEVEEM